MKPRHTNAGADDERREHTGVGRIYRRMGRSSGVIVCPFCQAEVLVFLWSLAGSGKRCPCGALLTTIGAYKVPDA